MSNITAIEDKEILKLTVWELKNLHLPPVTTVTLYEGSAPVENLRNRLTIMLEKNPWLTSRIVKKGTTDGIVAMAYSKTFDVESLLDQHFSVYDPGDVGLSLSMPYEELVHCLLPVQCARSKQATDANEPLFKVAVVPLEAKEKAEAKQAGQVPFVSTNDGLTSWLLQIPQFISVRRIYVIYSFFRGTQKTCRYCYVQLIDAQKG